MSKKSKGTKHKGMPVSRELRSQFEDSGSSDYVSEIFSWTDPIELTEQEKIDLRLEANKDKASSVDWSQQSLQSLVFSRQRRMRTFISDGESADRACQSAHISPEEKTLQQNLRSKHLFSDGRQVFWDSEEKNLLFYKNDVKVKNNFFVTPAQVGGGVRGVIKEWSRQARNRCLFFASNMNMSPKTMITLTYPSEYPTNGRDVKRHLDNFIKRMRRKFPSFQYLWVVEFQLRGAPHFHIFCNIRYTQFDLSEISWAWYIIVNSNDNKHLRAGTRVEPIRSEDGARRYVSKEMSKMYQKRVPIGFRNVGRFWGHSRGVSISLIDNWCVTKDTLFEICDIIGVDYKPQFQFIFGVSDTLLEFVLQLNKVGFFEKINKEDQRDTEDPFPF